MQEQQFKNQGTSKKNKSILNYMCMTKTLVVQGRQSYIVPQRIRVSNISYSFATLYILTHKNNASCLICIFFLVVRDN